jgi:hypothetical protein
MVDALEKNRKLTPKKEVTPERQKENPPNKDAKHQKKLEGRRAPAPTQKKPKLKGKGCRVLYGGSRTSKGVVRGPPLKNGLVDPDVRFLFSEES